MRTDRNAQLGKKIGAKRTKKDWYVGGYGKKVVGKSEPLNQ